MSGWFAPPPLSRPTTPLLVVELVRQATSAAAEGPKPALPEVAGAARAGAEEAPATLVQRADIQRRAGSELSVSIDALVVIDMQQATDRSKQCGLIVARR